MHPGELRLPGQQTEVAEPVERVQDAVAVAVRSACQAGMAGAAVLPAGEQEGHTDVQAVGRWPWGRLWRAATAR